ncbi:hypothetical protein CISIN_1g042688mg, partial [Citrus sinensis]
NNCNFPVIGSCNGLLAMEDRDKLITLLNPLTKKHRVLPKFDKNFPCSRETGSNGAFVNGALHWVAGDADSNYLIAAFDLKSEEFY